MATKGEVFAALARRARFEVVESSVSEAPRQLRFLGRVPLDRSGENMRRWLELVDTIQEASETAPWKADVSKSYFRSAGRQVYAWRIILQADAIAQELASIVRAVERARAPSDTHGSAGGLDEFPLPGASANRNAAVGGRRGAGTVGSIPLGPMALHNLRTGG